MFQGATEEQMSLVANSSMDHVSYILILFSLASLVFLFANMLIHLWDRLSNPALNTKDFNNGYTHVNGHAVEDGELRDAQEFELGELVSDDEEDHNRRMLDRPSLDTPSTLGKNNHTRVQ
jgi:hypothetical protein